LAQEKNIGGMLFVGCLFIGIGLGLLFNRPDIGATTGMGVGFILLALVRVRGTPVEVSLPPRIGGYFLLLVGIFLIFVGLSFLMEWEFIFPYLFGVFVILLGVGFIIFGQKVLRQSEREE